MKILRRVAAGVLAILVVMFCGAASAQTADSRTRAGAAPPRVDGFDVEQVTQLSPGTGLLFTLFGTPGAQATLRIDGAVRRLDLVEGQAGVYEGTYTLGAADNVAADSRVVANLRLHDEVVTTLLEEPLVLGAAALPLPQEQVAPVVAAAPQPSPPPLPEPALLPRVEERAVEPPCAACGVVEAVDVVQPRQREGWLGAIAGGLIGMILGDQVGQGDGRKSARVLGAVGGAYVGRQIERNSGPRTRYDVTVRMSSGVRRTVTFSSAPPLKVGDAVTFADGNVRRTQ
jgi:outer membrane lipoprotein SlyB